MVTAAPATMTESTTPASENLTLALALAGKGWYVFPCREKPGEPYRTKKGELVTPDTKTPYWHKDDLPHGKDNATTDPAIIRRWWTRWPAALVGIYCAKSGFFAVDIDVKHGADGKRSWTELVETCGNREPVEVGPMQQTPSGGAHMIFTLPADLDIPNNANKLAPGLDLRSNGYICTGGAYRWYPKHDYTVPLTNAPGWLLDRIRNLKNTEQAGQVDSQLTPDAGAYWLAYYLRRAKNGNRNDCGFDLACQLRDSGLSAGQAESIMREYASRVPQNGNGPYTEKEALASLEQAYDAPRRSPARLPGIAGEQSQQAAGGEVQPAPGLVLLTELGNSRRFSKAYHGQALHVEAWGWLTWNGRKWEDDETGRVVALGKRIVDNLFYDAQAALDAAKKLAGELQQASESEKDELKDRYDKALRFANDLLRWAMQSQTAQKIAAMVKLAESDLPARVEDFDADPWALNCQNGLLDLRTGELAPHNPARRITKIANAAYDPAAACPTWLRFLDRVFEGNQELIEYIQKAVGYSLTGQTTEQVFFFAYGCGRNGKSTFTNTLAALLGDYFHKAQSQTFMLRAGQGNGPTEGLAALAGARFVSASELARGQRLDEQIVKDLTGGDLVPARRLYKSEFNFRPALKLWFYGNEKPQVSGTDEGIWRRVRLIPFTVIIPENEVDPLLLEKLIAELPGILAWAVRGCMAWQRQGLGMPAAIKTATAEYRQEEDLIAQWIADCLDVNPSYEASITDLHNSFTRWGGGWTIKALSRELKRRGYISVRKAAGMVYKGLGIPQSQL